MSQNLTFTLIGGTGGRTATGGGKGTKITTTLTIANNTKLYLVIGGNGGYNGGYNGGGDGGDGGVNDGGGGGATHVALRTGTLENIGVGNIADVLIVAAGGGGDRAGGGYNGGDGGTGSGGGDGVNGNTGAGGGGAGGGSSSGGTGGGSFGTAYAGNGSFGSGGDGYSAGGAGGGAGLYGGGGGYAFSSGGGGSSYITSGYGVTNTSYDNVNESPSIKITKSDGTILFNSTTSGQDSITINGQGCTDVNAFNYDATANIDDGNCIDKVFGCTDVNALNYDSTANTDDGNCIDKVFGCTDDTYTQYNALANIDNGSCSTLKVFGCANNNYIEYSASANTDDGTCSIKNCNDDNYLEYTAESYNNNGCGILKVFGCTDNNYAEYSASANTDDGTCSTYFIVNDLFSNDGTQVINSFTNDMLDGWTRSKTSGSGWVQGGTPGWQAENNGRPDGSYIWIDFSGSDLGAIIEKTFDFTDITFNNLFLKFDYYSDKGIKQVDPPNTLFVEYYDGSNWNNLYTVQQFNSGWKEISIFLSREQIIYEDSGKETLRLRFRGESGGSNSDYLNDLLLSDIRIWTLVVLGCTDSNALNYDSNANVDDGTCIYVVLGCTDSNAFNYDSNANVDDGNCIDKVFGCTNTNFSNYDETSNIDDGSCIIKLSGSLIDGYISGANGGLYDINDLSAPIETFITDSSGKYEISTQADQLPEVYTIKFEPGGIDISTGKEVTTELTSTSTKEKVLAGGEVTLNVTPITSLVTLIVKKTEGPIDVTNLNEPVDVVTTVFNIKESDLEKDFIAEEDTNITGLVTQLEITIKSLTAVINNDSASESVILDSIANFIIESNNNTNSETINLADEKNITGIVEQVETDNSEIVISETLKENATSLISQVNTKVEEIVQNNTKSFEDVITESIQLSVSTENILTDDTINLNDNEINLTSVVNNIETYAEEVVIKTIFQSEPEPETEPEPEIIDYSGIKCSDPEACNYSYVEECKYLDCTGTCGGNAEEIDENCTLSYKM